MPRPSELDPAPLGYVTFAYVALEHRNRGVGGRMLDRLRAVATDEGFGTLVVWPSERSVPFWSRRGFVRDAFTMRPT